MRSPLTMAQPTYHSSTTALCYTRSMILAFALLMANLAIVSISLSFLFACGPATPRNGLGRCLPPTGSGLLWLSAAMNLLARGLFWVERRLLLVMLVPLRRLRCTPLAHASLSALPYRAYPLSCCLLD